MSTTNSQIGNLQIQLDKETFLSGEMITGHLMLTLN